MIDKTINYGQILASFMSLLTFVFLFIGGWYAFTTETRNNDLRQSSSMTLLEYRLNITDKALHTLSVSVDKLTSVLISITRLDEQMLAIQRRLDVVSNRIDNVEKRDIKQ